MKKMYERLTGNPNQVRWKSLFYGNLARLRVMVNFWIVCNDLLATLDRLAKFDVIDNIKCYFCNADESQQHLMFCCRETAHVWRKVLRWI